MTTKSKVIWFWIRTLILVGLIIGLIFGHIIPKVIALNPVGEIALDTQITLGVVISTFTVLLAIVFLAKLIINILKQ